MAKHRVHSVEFKRQVVQEYLSGETMHGLAKRHDLSRNLIRIWVHKYEAGVFDGDAAAAADMIQEYEARIAALERLVGKQALERCRREMPSSASEQHRYGCELYGLTRTLTARCPSGTELAALPGARPQVPGDLPEAVRHVQQTATIVLTLVRRRRKRPMLG